MHNVGIHISTLASPDRLVLSFNHTENKTCRTSTSIHQTVQLVFFTENQTKSIIIQSSSTPHIYLYRVGGSKEGGPSKLPTAIQSRCFKGATSAATKTGRCAMPRHAIIPALLNQSSSLFIQFGVDTAFRHGQLDFAATPGLVGYIIYKLPAMDFSPAILISLGLSSSSKPSGSLLEPAPPSRGMWMHIPFGNGS